LSIVTCCVATETYKHNTLLPTN